MIEKEKDNKEEEKKDKGEGQKGGSKKRVKKGSKQDRKRNRKVVFWVLMVTVIISLIFYISTWWNERGSGTKKKESLGVEVEMKSEKENDFMGGWGKPAVYEF